ncbi:MAG TPA: MFS transporter [Thermomicrobiales bacterium]|jgi:SET family sugar efflux transporter-like MFS transporter|nr:MFS transporter [Thermomicrobiales bacterium]
MADIAQPPASVLSIVWNSPFYRAATLSLLLAGTGVSAAMPQLTLFFTQELGASLSLAGLYYLTNLAAPIVGFQIGRMSDRQSDRLPLLRICGLIGMAGWLAMAAATQMWMVFAISVVALSVSGATGALLFAAVRDELSRKPTAADNRVVSTVRLAYTIGWVVGPVWGSFFGSVVGSRVLLVSVALLTGAQILPLIRHRVARFVIAAPRTVAAVGRRGEFRAMVPLLMFAGLCSIAVSGDTLKFSYLPIYMDEELGTSDAVRGTVMATLPATELIVMPLAAVLADRIGPWRVVVGGMTMGVLANLSFALSDGVIGLFAGQILMAGVWATLAGLGVTVAQQLYPQGVGVASTMFFSSLALASTIGGLVAAVAVGSLGLPQIFFVPTVLCALGVAGLGVLGVWHARSTREFVGSDLSPGNSPR